MTGSKITGKRKYKTAAEYEEVNKEKRKARIRMKAGLMKKLKEEHQSQLEMKRILETTILLMILFIH